MLRSKIDNYYVKHSCSRICQGDILRDLKINLISENEDDVEEIMFPYVIVMSQDCDLEHSYKSELDTVNDSVINKQFLPNIIVVPSFPSEIVKAGKHLLDIFNIKQTQYGKDDWKYISQNRNERYHFLNGYLDFQVPDLVIDFKTYFSFPAGNLKKVFKEHYLATVNELFRERLSQRFTNYFSRIALPEIALEQSA